MPRTRLALRVLLVSIAVSCLFAMAAVMGGDLDRTAGKMFASSLAVGLASLLAMAAFSAWQHAQARLIARACLASTTVALAGALYAVWAHAHGDLIFELVATASTIAVASAHAAVLAQTRLAPSYQWARPAVIACDALLAGAILSAIWNDSHHDELLLQCVAILGIAVAGLTLATLVMHAMSRTPAAAVTGERPVVCYCPGCGKRLWQPAGEIRCWHCEQTFVIELRVSAEPAHAAALT